MVNTSLLYASEKVIRGLPLPTEEGTVVDSLKPVVGEGTNYVGLEFDYANDYVYYSDVWNDIVVRVHRNGTGKLCKGESGNRKMLT